jgi:hypothetical protein
MGGVATWADMIAKSREPLPESHPLLRQEREAIRRVSDAFERWRIMRDAAAERAFSIRYGDTNRPAPIDDGP